MYSPISPVHSNSTYLATILFNSLATLRQLHSFPTRRSSDLAGRARRLRPAVTAGRLGEVRDQQDPRHADPLSPPGRDRKSTRLNSSHVEISYAVFCLKKKRGVVRGAPFGTVP